MRGFSRGRSCIEARVAPAGDRARRGGGAGSGAGGGGRGRDLRGSGDGADRRRRAPGRRRPRRSSSTGRAPPPATAAAESAAATRRRAIPRGSRPAPPARAPSEPPPPLYGAVGDRTAGDLVTTFKRVFPIAVSSDPLWDRVPVGFYAAGDVTFFLAEDGSLTHATASASAAPAFRAAILRTTALLKHRLFTARGAPSTHLHMVVRVTDQLVNHGAFTIDAAGSFELPSGRHVSVSIVER